MTAPKLPLTLPGGYVLTLQKARALQALSRCGAYGSCAVQGVMDGGLLSALVMFGLVERMAPDRLGGLRYRVTPAGLEMVERLGMGGQPPRPPRPDLRVVR